MDKKVENVPFIWMEESKEQFYTPMKSKRKFKSKKKEFVGWGSKPLIEFLQSIGKDTSQNLSQYDVTAIINTYVNENSLFHPKRKKTVVCDEKLHSLFGRKSVSRFKIHDMLEPHFVGNQEETESGDELFYSSDEEEDNVCATRKQHSLQKKKVVETPKSCFAAIVPENIKLVYLRRSLVENLIKKPAEFEEKVVGSIVRVKCDPNDYLKKNSHQLVREECKDFQQRMKDGLLKRLTVVGQYLTGSPCYGSFKATEVIELTDDEDKQEDQIGENQSVGEHLGSLIWYYLDPQGQTQGPFSTASLKRWSDAEYFPPDFKVWKKGESQENSVLLSNMLHQSYTG
ncbi:hypothetical protein PVL29_027309 [Vitis rotundifolia]|uniref:Uncharacterized protein n=1 Tax=Vitis rotundifolia TaxID=103349 RepID=A0AA39D606_VITRO|nr:hypothetical protein PVL29_027309 [Vitis rotundifolia]